MAEIRILSIRILFHLKESLLRNLQAIKKRKKKKNTTSGKGIGEVNEPIAG